MVKKRSLYRIKRRRKIRGGFVNDDSQYMVPGATGYYVPTSQLPWAIDGLIEDAEKSRLPSHLPDEVGFNWDTMKAITGMPINYGMRLYDLYKRNSYINKPWYERFLNRTHYLGMQAAKNPETYKTLGTTMKIVAPLTEFIAPGMGLSAAVAGIGTATSGIGNIMEGKKDEAKKSMEDYVAQVQIQKQKEQTIIDTDAKKKQTQAALQYMYTRPVGEEINILNVPPALWSLNAENILALYPNVPPDSPFIQSLLSKVDQERKLLVEQMNEKRPLKEIVKEQENAHAPLADVPSEPLIK